MKSCNGLCEPSTQRDSFNRPYIPRGCDQQGRIPEAAEAATEIGAQPEEPKRWWDALVSDTALALMCVAVMALLAWGVI